jgi:hypothetical protein
MRTGGRISRRTRPGLIRRAASPWVIGFAVIVVRIPRLPLRGLPHQRLTH